MKKSTLCAFALFVCSAVFAADFSVKVDAAAETGKVRALNGTNLAPPLSTEDAGTNLRADFKALNIPMTRLHDAPLIDSGLRLVDTDMIFANFHADENDPRNYYFEPTDDLIANTLACGTKIFYRLGISIDHSLRKYKIKMPPDPEKWARICIKIIEHYNEGWANGFHHNIEYWEIWNEPEGVNPSGLRNMWGGTYEQYVDFYCTVSKIIKKRFPNLKIGGPANCWANPEWIKTLANACKEKNAPLDFYSWHSYSNSVDEMVAQPFRVRKLLDELGFKNTELHLNEWHYFPLNWAQLRSPKDKEAQYKKITTLESGVFNCAVMTAWQDAPIDVGGYYYATKGNWGLFSPFGAKYKVYYGNMAFGEMVKYPTRLKTSSDKKNVYALAGKKADGERAVLVSLFKVGRGDLRVKLENAGDISKAKVIVYDDEKDFENSADFKIDGDTVVVPIRSDSAAVMVKF